MKSLFIRSASANLRAWVVLLIFGALLLIMRNLSTPGSAQSPSSTPVAQSGNQRILENTVPSEVPIKFKIKKEKEESFKSKTNENWLREFELELTNIGDKPIYFLYLTLASDVKVRGDRLVFPLVFGRAALGDIISPARPDDISIKPGETHVFKIHPGQVPAWERAVRDGDQPDATMLRAELQAISFGDGTGFFGNHPYPPASGQKSRLDGRVRQPNKGEPERALESIIPGRPHAGLTSRRLSKLLVGRYSLQWAMRCFLTSS
jgi:hypothetical protein